MIFCVQYHGVGSNARKIKYGDKCHNMDKTKVFDKIIEKYIENKNYKLDYEELFIIRMFFDIHLIDCKIYSKYLISKDFQNMFIDNCIKILTSGSSFRKDDTCLDSLVKFPKKLIDTFFQKIISFLKKDNKITIEKLKLISFSKWLFENKDFYDVVHNLFSNKKCKMNEKIPRRYLLTIIDYLKFDPKLSYYFLKKSRFVIGSLYDFYKYNVIKIINRYEKNHINTFDSWINSISHNYEILNKVITSERICIKKENLKEYLYEAKNMECYDQVIYEKKFDKIKSLKLLLEHVNNINEEIIILIFKSNFQFDECYFQHIIKKKGFEKRIVNIIVSLFSLNNTKSIKIIRDKYLKNKKYLYFVNKLLKLECNKDEINEFKDLIDINIISKSLYKKNINKIKIDKIHKIIEFIIFLEYDINKEIFDKILEGYISINSEYKDPNIILKLLKNSNYNKN